MKNGFYLFCGFIRRRPARLIVSSVCAFFCFLAFFGLSAARTSITASAESELEACGRSELILTCDEVSRQELCSLLENTAGVSRYTLAYRYETKAVCSDGRARTVRLLSIEEGGLVRPLLTGGLSDGGFYLSRGYAADFGVESFASITLESGYTLFVRGECVLPFYSAVYLDGSAPSTNGDVADVYTSMDELHAISGGEYRNIAFIDTEPEADADAVAEALLDSAGAKVNRVIRFEDEPAVYASDQLMKLVLPITRLFPAILFVLGVVFIFIFLTGVASASRNTLAVLMTDGMSLFEIFAGLFMASLASLAAGMILALLPAYLLGRSTATAVTANMGIPFAGMRISPRLVPMGLLICVAVSAAAALTAVLTVAGKTILHVKKAGRKNAAAVIAEVLIACVCTACSFFIIYASLMHRDSIDEVRREVFFERKQYDAAVVYKGFVPADDIEKLTGYDAALTAEPVLLVNADLEFNGSKTNVSAVGLSSGSSLMKFRYADGTDAFPEGNRVILDSAAAELLGAKPGDTVKASLAYNGKRVNASCIVGGVSEQHSAFCSLFLLDTVAEYMDSSGLMNCVLIKYPDAGFDEDAFSAYASSVEDVYAVQTLSTEIKRFDGRYSSVYGLTDLIIADGIMLGLSMFAVAGYAVWRSNLKKNSILLMLGSGSFAAAVKDLLKWICGMLLGLMIGIPIGIVFEKKLLRMLSTRLVSYPYVFRFGTLTLACGTVLCFMLATTCVYAFALRRHSRDVIRSNS